MRALPWFWVGSSGLVIQASGAFRAVLGDPKDSVVGRSVWSFSDAAMLGWGPVMHAALLVAALHGNTPSQLLVMPYTLRRANGATMAVTGYTRMHRDGLMLCAAVSRRSRHSTASVEAMFTRLSKRPPPSALETLLLRPDLAIRLRTLASGLGMADAVVFHQAVELGLGLLTSRADVSAPRMRRVAVGSRRA